MVNRVRSIRAPISCRSWIAGGSGCPTGTATSGPLEAPYVKGEWWDPYNQNVLKGDYPIFGQNIFLNLSAISDTLFEARRLPTPSDVSRPRIRAAPTSSATGTRFLSTRTSSSRSELFKGDTAFKPRDWELRLTGVFNINYLNVEENGVVNVDVREGTDRTMTSSSLQEFFVEYHLGDLTPNYDFVSTRLGHPGLHQRLPRLHLQRQQRWASGCSATWAPTGNQFNAAYFRPLEKDTNSGLNRLFDTRDQNIAIANYFRQDFLRRATPLQASFHYLHDRRRPHTDKNGFVVRPAVGRHPGRRTPSTRSTSAGRATATSARSTSTTPSTRCSGRDSRNPISARSQEHQRADGRPRALHGLRLGPAEVHVLLGLRRRQAARRAAAAGFDSILDNPNFAGGGFSFWVRQGIPLTTTSLELKGRNSLLPALRSSKIEGQPNYVNPGLFLFGLGADFDVTPKTQALFQANYLRFHHTEPLAGCCSSRTASGRTWAGT